MSSSGLSPAQLQSSLQQMQLSMVEAMGEVVDSSLQVMQSEFELKLKQQAQDLERRMSNVMEGKIQSQTESFNTRMADMAAKHKERVESLIAQLAALDATVTDRRKSHVTVADPQLSPISKPSCDVSDEQGTATLQLGEGSKEQELVLKPVKSALKVPTSELGQIQAQESGPKDRRMSTGEVWSMSKSFFADEAAPAPVEDETTKVKAVTWTGSKFTRGCEDPEDWLEEAIENCVDAGKKGVRCLKPIIRRLDKESRLEIMMSPYRNGGLPEGQDLEDFKTWFTDTFLTMEQRREAK
eukprot:Nk52_evm1s713 gene=Nk52_evmTU1s713